MARKDSVISVTVDVGFDGKFVVACEYKGARYHYWSDAGALNPRNDALYKTVMGSNSGLHKLSIAKNQWLVSAMRETALADGALEKAEQVRRDKEAMRLADARAKGQERAIADLRWLATSIGHPLDAVSDSELLASLNRIFAEMQKKVA